MQIYIKTEILQAEEFIYLLSKTESNRKPVFFFSCYFFFVGIFVMKKFPRKQSASRKELESVDGNAEAMGEEIDIYTWEQNDAETKLSVIQVAVSNFSFFFIKSLFN